MKLRYALLCAFTISVLGCDTTPTGQKAAGNDYTYFVTKLGSDTLAIERFKTTGDQLIAHVVLRSPRTVLRAYQLTLDDNGGIEEMLRFNPTDTKFNSVGAPISQTIRAEGDSLVSETAGNDGNTRRFAMVNERGTLPFIDMVHWPYELAFNNAATNPNDSIDQRLLTGRRLSSFIIHKVSNDSLTLRHPSRGVMGIDVGTEGELIRLDAALTTRKLIVERVDQLDFESVANSFLERDKNGSPFGSLSGAVERDFSFKGATFSVSHGSPMKRGRTIFGGIVSWGNRWRTGANRATHFKTSSDLSIGDLKVPAGEYTLFTIPEPGGGTLIINKQTGQNGQSYNESRDLGRVPMSINTQNDVTEAFTILVEETSSGGVLKLVWDRTVFSVDFTLD